MNTINEIHLHDVLPDVFAGRTPQPPSDVWLRPDVTLTRPGLYLIEAASGTGKTSLVSFITGQRTDYAGTIRLNHDDARTLRPALWTQLRQRHLSLVHQELRLFPELTVWDNLMVKAQLTRSAATATIAAWLDRVGLADKRDAPVGRLSLGQQQRVALVRALCQPFDVLLADEPVSHVDAATAAAMAALLADELQARRAMLIATSIGQRPCLPWTQVLRL